MLRRVLQDPGHRLIRCDERRLVPHRASQRVQVLCIHKLVRNTRGQLEWVIRWHVVVPDNGHFLAVPLRVGKRSESCQDLGQRVEMRHRIQVVHRGDPVALHHVAGDKKRRHDDRQVPRGVAASCRDDHHGARDKDGVRGQGEAVIAPLRMYKLQHAWRENGQDK